MPLLNADSVISSANFPLYWNKYHLQKLTSTSTLFVFQIPQVD
jgi:hypothetical protein